MTNLVKFFTIKYIHPRRIITNYSHICCGECAGFFLLALSKPAAVNLLVLLPTICLAFPKCHSTVIVFIVRGLILSPFFAQNISMAETWLSNKALIQNQVSSAKRLNSVTLFSLTISSCRAFHFENQSRVGNRCVCCLTSFSWQCGPSRPLHMSTTIVAFPSYTWRWALTDGMGYRIALSAGDELSLMVGDELNKSKQGRCAPLAIPIAWPHTRSGASTDHTCSGIALSG
jgi:hypothetical protein